MAPICINCSGTEFVWAGELKTGGRLASGPLALRAGGELPLGTRICRSCGHADLFLRDVTVLQSPHHWRPGEFVPITAPPHASHGGHHRSSEPAPHPHAQAPNAASPTPPTPAAPPPPPPSGEAQAPQSPPPTSLTSPEPMVHHTPTTTPTPPTVGNGSTSGTAPAAGAMRRAPDSALLAART